MPENEYRILHLHVVSSKLDNAGSESTHVDDSEEIFLARNHAEFGVLLIIDQSRVRHWFHTLSNSFRNGLVPVKD